MKEERLEGKGGRWGVYEGGTEGDCTSVQIRCIQISIKGRKGGIILG